MLTTGSYEPVGAPLVEPPASKEESIAGPPYSPDVHFSKRGPLDDNNTRRLREERRDGDLLVLRKVRIRGVQRRLGRKHHRLGVHRGELVGEVREVRLTGSERLVAPLLADLVGRAVQEVAQALEALLVGRHRRVQIADRRDDRLVELRLVELEVAQVADGLVVDGEGALEVGVAVRREGEVARNRVNGARPAVRAAHDAHLVPQVIQREHAAHDAVGAARRRPRRVEPAALGDVVDLRRHREALGLRRREALERRVGCPRRG
mmetsp:Transcript_3815/g.15103  ORF Transcript_3815/g.15103 Transcript_3815/m.15103 type:complete len:263 (+) Transcript_3815:31-819(+)